MPRWYQEVIQHHGHLAGGRHAEGRRQGDRHQPADFSTPLAGDRQQRTPNNEPRRPGPRRKGTGPSCMPSRTTAAHSRGPSSHRTHRRAMLYSKAIDNVGIPADPVGRAARWGSGPGACPGPWNPLCRQSRPTTCTMWTTRRCPCHIAGLPPSPASASRPPSSSGQPAPRSRRTHRPARRPRPPARARSWPRPGTSRSSPTRPRRPSTPG